MVKLPRNIKGRDLVKVLLRLGFKEVGRRGSHIRFKHPDGRWTQVAIHNKPIPQGTLRAVLRQTKLSPEKLSELL
jgi:predicted RNA binding protein YcfA (HicA-like mRNA interferase family)